MFTQFYGLSGPPFQLSPDYRFFFGSRNHKRALAYLTYGLNQGEGFIVITGDIGAGKTTIVEHLLSTLDAEQYVPAKVVTTQLEADDLLCTVVAAFGLAVDGCHKANLLHRLEEFLRGTHRSDKRALLIIDEVQNLPVRSLEELRMLSNFQMHEKPLLQSFLLGQPQFRLTLASDELKQLRQRMIATYHLGPMDAEETRAYVEHRLNLVGWKKDPELTEDAFRLIYEHTFGIPRTINSLGTRLLLFGALENRHRIDASAVDEVVADLVLEGAEGRRSAEPRAGAAADPAMVNGTAHHSDVARQAARLLVLEEALSRESHPVRRALDLSMQSVEAWLRAARAGEMGGR